MPNVNFNRLDYAEMLPIWELIRVANEGTAAIKAERDVLLPRPNPTDTSPANVARYEAYILRAVFYNATRRTTDGLVGQVFTRPAVIKLPPRLEILETDANGSGVTLAQLGKSTVRATINYGRAGLLTDFPVTDGQASVADLENGSIQPTINLYDPQMIINWRTRKRGAKHVLSLVVIREDKLDDDDVFETDLTHQWRVLTLEDQGDLGPEVYTVRIWTDSGTADDQGNSFESAEPVIPLDANGDVLDYIPFTFVGAEDNDVDIDLAPMYDIASLNIAHYRNSADYEEAAYITGQPTPVFAGLDRAWAEEVMGNVVELGSRAAILLPVGGTATLLQAEERGMTFEAMTHKEKQMQTLGAKLIQPQEVERTATDALIDKSSENSVLGSVTVNVNDAITQSLEWAAAFIGDDAGAIEFALNTEFTTVGMTPEERRQLVLEWQSGLLTDDEARNVLRKTGVATEENDAAILKIEQQRVKRQEEEAALQEQNTIPAPQE